MFNLFIKNKFAQSLRSVERFFEMLSHSYSGCKLILGLIEELKKRGFEKKLRAGTQLAALVLSRSREHGLRFDQAWIRIYYNSDGTMHLAHQYLINDEKEVISQEQAKESDFFSLVDILVKKPID